MVEKLRRLGGSPKERVPAQAEKLRDGESVSDFMRGLVEDLGKLRRKQASIRGDEHRSESERESEMKEVDADMIMVERELERASAQMKLLESHATFDALTDLPNKRAFAERLHSEVGHLNRLAAHSVHEKAHLLFIDLDNFKWVNDTLGHDVGDRYLQIAAKYMQKELRRDTDMLARLGGDEFTAILFGNRTESSKDIAEKVGEAVRRASVAAKKECHEKGIELGPEEGNISASIGLVAFRENELPESLVKRADAAMYEAKRLGRNRVVVAE
ncbi:MAG: GGDEF domain-containing protein [Candidatus Paceibacterota bacterium]|jgi:diguanylate cyclase (GGDEF)-like protein